MMNPRPEGRAKFRRNPYRDESQTPHEPVKNKLPQDDMIIPNLQELHESGTWNWADGPKPKEKK